MPVVDASISQIKRFDLYRVRRLKENLAQERLQRFAVLARMLRREPGTYLIFMFGLLFLITSSILYVGTGGEIISVPFTNTSSTISFLVDRDINGPLAAYIAIDNFYTNVRLYMDSGSNFYDHECTSPTTVEELSKVRDPNSLLPPGWKPSDPFWPCGLQSAAYFNDEIKIVDFADNEVKVLEEFSYPSNVFVLYAQTSHPQQWIKALFAPRLQQWYLNSFTSRRLLLLGPLNVHHLPQGYYKLIITKNAWPADQYKAKKTLVIMSVGVLGSRQNAIILISFSAGLLCFVVGGIFRFGIQRGLIYESLDPDEFRALHRLWASRVDKWS